MLSELIILYTVFFKIGLIGFGGGFAIINVMKEQLVGLNLISTAEFYDIVAISQMTPGPISVNAATYIGAKVAGVLGSAVATLGMFTPSFVLVVIFAYLVNKYKQATILESLLKGVRPITVGMIFSAALAVIEGSILNTDIIQSVTNIWNGMDFLQVVNLIPVGIFIIVWYLSRRLSPISCMFISALLGIVSTIFI